MEPTASGAATAPTAPAAGANLNGAAAAPNSSSAQDTEQPTVVPGYDEWYASQDATGKAVIDGRMHSLENAYEAVKAERRQLSKQLEALAKENEPLREQLTQMRKEMELSGRKADFMEEAAKQGCSNPKLAFHIAETEGTTLAGVAAAYPELFKRAAATQTAAGAGVGKGVPPALSMNAAIRKAAGRG